MRPLSLFALALAGVAAAGCPSPETRIAPRAPPAWQDTGTPPAKVVELEREVRYYVDETGATWDDRGRRVSARP